MLQRKGRLDKQKQMVKEKEGCEAGGRSKGDEGERKKRKEEKTQDMVR